jgi:hypothetical protein
MAIARSKQDGLEAVRRLVEQFRSRDDYYSSDAYDETTTRERWINPLFEALGWDVLDQADRGEGRDVLYHVRFETDAATAGQDEWDEDVTDEELAERRPRILIPDYSFRLDGVGRFFVEAKKPHRSLHSRSPAYQLKEYAWNHDIGVSVLTSFREFRAFDCTLTPEYERPDTGVLPGFDLTYDQYEASWDRLWDTFSREAVAGGSLAMLHLAFKSGRLTGAVRVGEAFLRDLDVWRGKLASELYHRNHGLDVHQLAEATQRILDRLVFLRVCEDRAIEPRIVLRRYARVTNAYHHLVTTEFRRLDSVYNGQLFAHHFSEALDIGDPFFQDVVASLYFPRSRYRFDVIGPDLLGSVYERFLGNELEIEADGTVRVVEKPEVRHSGGVYYTPRWIVERIVARTLDPFLEGVTPRAVANLRIVDPACGSGSFLLGALDHLIRWHEKYFEAHPKETPERHFVDTQGRRRLSGDAKADILTRNIYGVDIDPQAVEVTQMSLYLKVLEGENQQTLTTQQRLFQRAYLPPLDGNIRWGNSLLDFADVPATLLHDELAFRINPFDWQDPHYGFGDVFARRGGFDAVIGNPPYTRVQVLRRFRPEETGLYANKYSSAATGSFDIAGPFIEKGLSLLRRAGSGGGRFGFIVSRQFTETDAGQPLREALSAGRHVEEIVDFEDGLVFEGVGAYTVLLHLTAAPNREYTLTRVSPPPMEAALASAESTESVFTGRLPASTLGADEWDLALPSERTLLDRLAKTNPDLGSLTDAIFQGVITGADFVFCLEDHGSDPANNGCRLVSPRDEDIAPFPIESDLLRPVYGGRSDLRPFRAHDSSTVLLLPYERPSPNDPFVLIPRRRLATQYPHAWDWLRSQQPRLEDRAGDWNSDNWHQFSRRQNLERYDGPKIMIPYMVEKLCAHLDKQRHYFVNVSTGGYGVSIDEVEDPEYLEALLNTRLLSWVLKRYSRAWRGGWFAARNRNLSRLPINTKSTAVQRAAIKDAYARCVELAERVESTRSDQQRNLSERHLATAVNALDGLTESLYGLTPEERALLV